MPAALREDCVQNRVPSRIRGVVPVGHGLGHRDTFLIARPGLLLPNVQQAFVDIGGVSKMQLNALGDDLLVEALLQDRGVGVIDREREALPLRLTL